MARTRAGRAHVLIAASLVALLSGCSPVSLGVTGVSVDESGSPVVVLGVCRDHIDGGGILDTGADGKAYRSAGSWLSPSPAGRGVTLLPVGAPPAGWVQERPLRPLQPGVRYVAWGSTRDSKAATDGFDFTVADLQELTPDTVMYLRVTEDSDGDLHEDNHRVKISDFLKIACPESR